MQMPRVWIVIVCLIGSASLGESLDLSYGALKISSGTAELESPSSPPPEVDSGKKLHANAAGKPVNLSCLYLLNWHLFDFVEEKIPRSKTFVVVVSLRREWRCSATEKNGAEESWLPKPGGW